MQIKTTGIAEGGATHEVGGVYYHFAPNKDGDHVAEVTDPAHIARFLSITDGFERYGSNETPSDAMFVTIDEVEVDLMLMDKDALFNLAKEDLGLYVTRNYGEAKLREVIMTHANG